jgi:lipoate-protein ligase A
MPSRQPDYRGGREHAAFLSNLPGPAAELRRRLRSGWGADEERQDWPEEEVARLVAEKYSQAEWVRRR